MRTKGEHPFVSFGLSALYLIYPGDVHAFERVIFRALPTQFNLGNNLRFCHAQNDPALAPREHSGLHLERYRRSGFANRQAPTLGLRTRNTTCQTGRHHKQGTDMSYVNMLHKKHFPGF